MNTGWLLAGFAPQMTTRSLSITSCSEQVVAATPMVCLSPSVDGRVAHPGGRVDPGDAHGPGRLAGRVVDLVGDAPARQVERGPIGAGRRRWRSAQGGQRLVPADAVEAPVAPAAAHRVAEPAERPQLGARPRPQRLDVGQQRSGRTRRRCSPRAGAAGWCTGARRRWSSRAGRRRRARNRRTRPW